MSYSVYLERQDKLSKLQTLYRRYESLTRLLAYYNPKPLARKNLQDRRQIVANQIWEVKQWLYTH